MARLLVIEDNADNLELMAYLLRARGHEVVSAGDGIEGMAAVRRDPPDLIVCDVHLPKMDGYAVAHEIKSDAALRHIPLIAVTALAMVGDRDRVLAAGFDAYLAKPIDPPEFARQVEAYLPASRGGKMAAAPAVPTVPAVAAAPPLPALSVDHAPPVARRALVLAVDDLATNLEVIRATLEPAGFSVVLASSVHEALAQLRQHADDFDLIVSDLHMPHTDGHQFIEAVHSDPRLRRIPFICITSSLMADGDKRQMLALGAARVILRPLEPQQLLAEIAACLRELEEMVDG